MVYITRIHLIKCAQAYGQEYGNDTYGYKVLSGVIEGMFCNNTLGFNYAVFTNLFGTWTTDLMHSGNDLI